MDRSLTHWLMRFRNGIVVGKFSICVFNINVKIGTNNVGCCRKQTIKKLYEIVRNFVSLRFPSTTCGTNNSSNPCVSLSGKSNYTHTHTHIRVKSGASWCPLTINKAMANFVNSIIRCTTQVNATQQPQQTWVGAVTWNSSLANQSDKSRVVITRKLCYKRNKNYCFSETTNFCPANHCTGKNVRIIIASVRFCEKKKFHNNNSSPLPNLLQFWLQICSCLEQWCPFDVSQCHCWRSVQVQQAIEFVRGNFVVVRVATMLTGAKHRHKAVVSLQTNGTTLVTRKFGTHIVRNRLNRENSSKKKKLKKCHIASLWCERDSKCIAAKRFHKNTVPTNDEKRLRTAKLRRFNLTDCNEIKSVQHTIVALPLHQFGNSVATDKPTQCNNNDEFFSQKITLLFNRQVLNGVFPW